MPTPVCPEPKLFAGQLPFESTTAEVQALFSKYGVVRSAQVITGPDGRSKGCAMVLFNTWAEAELAVEGENGSTQLGGKALVVKFADPPRKGDGPVVGIAPRKLFVGQIPATMTEEQLRSMFTPFGNATEVHLLKTKGCGFVTYQRWSECEAAIAGLHNKTQLDGAKLPVVVKFADAKVNDFTGSKRTFENGTSMINAAALAGAAAAKKAGFSAGMMPGGGFPFPMGYGMNMPGMQPGMMNPYMMGMGMGMQGMQGMQGMGMGMQAARPGMGGMGGGMGAGIQPKSIGVGNQAMQASKMGVGVMDESVKQWKLFVGQVPFDASEQDLWNSFSTVGNILELVILRTPQGKSKGCAFITYDNRVLADAAVRKFDAQPLPEDPKQRPLIVKFAGPMGNGNGNGASHSASVMGASNGDVHAAPGPMHGAVGMGGGYSGMPGQPGYDVAAGAMAGALAQHQMGGMQHHQMGGVPQHQQQHQQQDLYMAQMLAQQQQQQGQLGHIQGQQATGMYAPQQPIGAMSHLQMGF